MIVGRIDRLRVASGLDDGRILAINLPPASLSVPPALAGGELVSDAQRGFAIRHYLLHPLAIAVEVVLLDHLAAAVLDLDLLVLRAVNKRPTLGFEAIRQQLTSARK